LKCFAAFGVQCTKTIASKITSKVYYNHFRSLTNVLAQCKTSNNRCGVIALKEKYTIRDGESPTIE